MTVAAAEPAPEVRIRLNERQLEALHSEANELLYGGAAYGGKSHLLRVAAIIYSIQVPLCQSYLFRRHYDDLVKNHLVGPGGFHELLAPMIQRGDCRIIGGPPPRVQWANGSIIHLCHLQHERDLQNYQGAEIHLMLMDELTHFRETEYRYLRHRLRLGSLRVPEGVHLPRIIAATNPGSIGHAWVRKAWITSAAPCRVHRAEPADGGMLRVFIPARLEDNPAIDLEEYEQRLTGLGDDALVRAYREGDWNIVAGGALDDVWRDHLHVVADLDLAKLPKGWRIDRSFDWGASHPFSVGWHAEVDEPCKVRLASGEIVYVRAGSVIRLAEWYGCTSRRNEGLRLSPEEIASGILMREREMGLEKRIRPGPADPSIWAEPGEESIASKMRRAGVEFLTATTGPGSRVHGLQVLRARLKAAHARPMEEPCYLVTQRCSDFLETVPALPRDPRKPDDVDSRAEDHAFDECRYRLLAGSSSTEIGGLGW